LSKDYISPNDFGNGSQTSRIAAAIEYAKNDCRKVVIPSIDRVTNAKIWMIDSAIMLPSDFTLVLDNCTVKLSDRCRDNFIRTANLQVGQSTFETYRNIHIIGIGNVLLEGADNPRATGDCFKQVSTTNSSFNYSYGTDEGKTDINQFGGWLNHGINIVETTGFSIENITLKNYHGHGIIIARSSKGVMRGITFDACGYIFIAGQKRFVKNQDGFGIRQGCHDIIIENCTGNTGDDFIMIGEYFNDDASFSAGKENTVSPCGDNYRGEEDDTYNIICRNLYGVNACHWKLIKLMASGKQKQYNFIFSDIVANVDSRISFTNTKFHPDYTLISCFKI
jgi:polygalacturonase